MQQTKRMRGQITVLAGMVILLVISVICTSIYSALAVVSKAKANAAGNLAIESVFANFSRPLSDRFNILLLPDSERFEEELQRYTNLNCDLANGFELTECKAVEIAEKLMATDQGGTLFAKEILDYMQYGIISDFAQMLMGYDKQLEKEKKTQELVEEIAACEEYTVVLDQNLLMFVNAVEGIAYDGHRFQGRDGYPVADDKGFIKQLTAGHISMQSMGVRDGRVYDTMHGKYQNIVSMLDDVAGDAGSLRGMIGHGAEDEEVSDAMEALDDSIGDVAELLADSCNACAVALECCNRYDVCKQQLSVRAEQIEGHISESTSVIGAELSESFSKDIAEIKECKATEQSLCDMEQFSETLKLYHQQADSLNETFGRLNDAASQGDYSAVMDLTGQCQQKAYNLDYSNLDFNYTGVVFESGEDGVKLLKKIKRLFADGVMGLILPEESEVSDKTVGYSDLAGCQAYAYPEQMGGTLEQVKNNVLYNEYALMEFPTYTDVHRDGEMAATAALLEYQTEYIIGGNRSDRDNLQETLLRLTAIREGANLTYLLTDTAKKGECYALSLSIFGFTGISALVKAGQYLIMALWAYGESIEDVKLLVQGKKAELIKTAEHWQLDLKHLLSGSFESAQGQGQTGLTYEQYLRIVLFLMNRTEKYFRTMDLMELYMIQQGYKDFRMRNQVYAMEAQMMFAIRINGVTKQYYQQTAYQY